MSAESLHQTHIDYERAAAPYAQHRDIHLGVLAELIAGAAISGETRVLDVGCGTGNYARALQRETGCRISGIEPTDAMRANARNAANWDVIVQGSAESLPFPDASFDLVMSTDVIHHVGDRPAFFREALRVLDHGGRIATVTDSTEDIARRRPLSSHFPETVAVEQQRYPTIGTLQAEMTAAGFQALPLGHTEMEYDLTRITAYRDRAFSSLHLIDEDAFQRGIERLDADLASGPVPSLSLYTIVWGEKPRSPEQPNGGR
jgi:ubiquinone/menaquinone biosynthesis C-methylase UbiE